MSHLQRFSQVWNVCVQNHVSLHSSVEKFVNQWVVAFSRCRRNGTST